MGLCATAWADGTAGKPPRIIVDKDVCPLVNCRFGKWKNIKRTDLVDNPGGAVIGSVVPGDKVTAITGEVHASPVKVNVLIDHDPFKKGDVFYLYYYEGVNARIWYKGKIWTIRKRGNLRHDGSSGGLHKPLRFRLGQIGRFKTYFKDASLVGSGENRHGPDGVDPGELLFHRPDGQLKSNNSRFFR